MTDTPVFATIADIIHAAAERFPDRPAYWTTAGKNEFDSFTDVHTTAEKIADYLISRGVRKGDSVCVYAPNTHQWPLVFWGIILAGGVVVPVDPNSGSAEIEHILQDTQSNCIFATGSLLPNIKQSPDTTIVVIDGPADGEFDSLAAIQATPGAGCTGITIEPDDHAVIIYTSGTTSQPKGVVLSHGNIVANLSDIVGIVPLSSEDLFLSIISLSHTFEITCGLVMPFMIGASVVYAPNLRYTTLFRYAGEFQPTIMLCVPMMFKMLLENAINKVTGQHLLSLLDIEKDEEKRQILAARVRDVFGGNSRYFISGGAPLANAIQEGYEEVGIPLLQGYGLTETAGVSTLTPPDALVLGSAGRAIPSASVRIEEPDSNGIGEICISGRHLMAGYHNNPQATAEMIRNGWLYSGDLGYLDPDGNLFITGRAKNVIVTAAGVNVYPEELEERIKKSPFISDICVVGKEKPDRTETVFAAVIINESNVNEYIEEIRKKGEKPPLITEIIRSELEKHTADLASFKRILDFHIRSRPLPRNRTNKVVRAIVKRESFSILGRLGQLQHYEETEQPIVFTNATAITPFRIAARACLIVEGGKITQFGSFDRVYLPPNARIIDLKDSFIMPGFIDLHVHGGSGYDFSRDSQDDLGNTLSHFIEHGTTHLLATIYVEERTRFLQAITNIATLCRQHSHYGIIHGIHLEGPFINKEMRGALNENHIWDATIDNLLTLLQTGDGYIRLMTLAPEVPGAQDVMQVASQEGVVLAVAHSKASLENIEIAIDQGLSQVTHIFNAMAPLHHRNPGVLAASFLRRELKVHLIADGVHVHPEIVNLLYRLKGAQGIILISDAISASGCKDGDYVVSGQIAKVRNGEAYLDGGTIAGSTVTLDQALKFVVERSEIPLQEAVRMVTLNPARVLRLDHKKGSIAVGKDADLVVIDKNFTVQMTIIDGDIVYTRP